MQFTKMIASAITLGAAMAITGDLTYYETGLGACGKTSYEGDYVCAIGHGMYEAATIGGNPNNNPYCGKQIRATLPATGKTVTVTVVDSCGGCADNALDFAGGAWNDITNGAAPTRYHDLEWNWVGRALTFLLLNIHLTGSPVKPCLLTPSLLPLNQLDRPFTSNINLHLRPLPQELRTPTAPCQPPSTTWRSIPVCTTTARGTFINIAPPSQPRPAPSGTRTSATISDSDKPPHPLRSYSLTIIKDAAKHLHETQRKAQERQGCLPVRIAVDGGNMQPLPHVLLPQLQQQDQGQDQASDGRVGAGSEGGGGIPGEESAPSFPFTSRRGLRPSQSPVFNEASRQSPSRRSSPESPTLLGRRKLSRDNRADTQEVALYRPQPGSRAEPPSQWPRAPSQVPPQLVGGSAGADAGILISSPNPITEYKTQMRSLLARSSFPRSSASVHPPTPRSQHSHHSHHSSSTMSSITSQSSYASSYAYIFRRKKPDLRLLRKSSKPPQHLKPRASAVKTPVSIDVAQRTAGPRVVEDTGYVESTTKHITPPPMEIPIALTLPELLKAEPPPKPLRKVQTLRFKSLVVEGRQPKHTLKTAVSRPVLSRPIPPQISTLEYSPDAVPSQMGLRVLHFGSLHEDETVQRTSRKTRLNERSSGSRGQRGSSRQSSRNSSRRDLTGMRKHYRDDTPSEQAPNLANGSAFRHGDSYFHHREPEATYCKEYVPWRTPVANEDREPSGYFVTRPDLTVAGDEPLPNEQLQRSSTMQTTISAVAKRKSSTFFKLFRRSVFKEKDDHDYNRKASRKHGSEMASSNIESKKSPEWADVPLPQLTPGITLSSPADSKGEYTRSLVPELHSPSYFGRAKLLGDDSSKSLTPSPGHASPTDLKPDRASPSPLFPGPRHHKRSSSEALSPMSRPQKSSILRHSSILESEGSPGTAGQVLPGFISPTPYSRAPETASHNPEEYQPHRREKIQQQPSIASLALPDLRSKQSQALTFQEPVLRKKPSAWKNLVNGIRKVSSLGFHARNRGSSSEEDVERHDPLLRAKRSFAKLKLRPSLSAINVRNGKLVRKSSRDSQLQSGSVDTEDEEKPSVLHQKSFPQQTPPQPRQPRPIRPEDLIVTNFEQTPFSKRYYDSIRTEQQAIRAFIDETMEEDDEECDEVVLGFEQNVPDHLPKSPLCPLHPKHKSGGKAICPLHGRYKPPKRPPSPMHKMEIVFDTRENDTAGQPGATAAQAKLTTGIDGTEAYLKRSTFMSQQTFRSRRMQQTSSMGSDGAESLELVHSESSADADAWSRPRRQRLHHLQRRGSECARGRNLFRGESALDIRKRRAKRHRERC
ncbi:hypothetical protein CBER1_07656 [Cercospora berteroae]|uniref:RlpA-like protein double-psi beta-barrel domain-containing protein n=1 Tax=Cercospora berteroae TaxID=357750 RepID=A0A2S6C4K9_9PEZI|nr:hypothetical protein CBER1_07656 [Cercospora berteroae]